MAAFNLSLAKLQIAIDRAWRDSKQQTQYNAYVEALKYQLAVQTATIGPIIMGTGKNAKKLTRTIYWPTKCTTTLSACTDECLPGTEEASDSSKDVTLTCLREAKFIEGEKRFRDSPLMYDEVVALDFLAAMKSLDEYFTQQYIAFLDTNRGTHVYSPNVGSLGADGYDWEVPATDWNVNLIPEMMLGANLGRFTSPFLLDGTNFYTQLIVANANQANLDGKGVSNLFGQFNVVSDPQNMIVAAPNKTYMVDPSAVAFVTGNYWGTTPESRAGVHRMWKQPSKNLPGVYYDVHEIEACSSNDFTTSWKIQLNGAFVVNPLGCTATNTGILAFERLPGI